MRQIASYYKLRKDTIWSAAETATVACFLRFVPVCFEGKDIHKDARDMEVIDQVSLLGSGYVSWLQLCLDFGVNSNKIFSILDEIIK